jgi:hypothetical protein
MVEHKDILAIVRILRKVTKIVKIYPFVYTVLYALCMIGYFVCDDIVSVMLDQLFYTSPIVVSCNILLSYSLKLCKWHRLQCLLPMFPLIPLFVDYLVFPVSKLAFTINALTIILLFALSLINAYFVFIKPKNNETYTS